MTYQLGKTIVKLVRANLIRVRQLVFWFKWEKADTALTYTRTRDLAKTMGITKLPI